MSTPWGSGARLSSEGQSRRIYTEPIVNSDLLSLCMIHRGALSGAGYDAGRERNDTCPRSKDNYLVIVRDETHIASVVCPAQSKLRTGVLKGQLSTTRASNGCVETVSKPSDSSC